MLPAGIQRLIKIPLVLVYPLCLPLFSGGGPVNNDLLRENNSKYSTICPYWKINSCWPLLFRIKLTHDQPGF
jgi:hypothetical protein